MHTFEIQPLTQDFIKPVYSTPGAAAFDIFSPIETKLKKGDTRKIGLGFKASVPVGYVALLVTRSGQGCNFGVGLRNQVGVIDSDYRGEWAIQLSMDHFDNGTSSTESYIIKKGDRLVQCLLVPVIQANIILVNGLDSTSRGEGGFGSTGR